MFTEQINSKELSENITGIGPKSAELLVEAGILSFEDLAQSTPEQLASIIQPVIPRLNAQRIESENWIGQARQVAGKPEAEKLIPESGSSESVAFSIENDSSTKSTEKKKTRTEYWIERHVFQVIFCDIPQDYGETGIGIKVHYFEGDENHNWDELAVKELDDWMLSRVGVQMSHNTETAEDAPGPEALEKVVLSLSEPNLSFVPPAEAGGVGKVRLEVSFHLSGDDAPELTYERVLYEINTYLYETERKSSELVDNWQDECIPAIFSYDVIREFPTPLPGNYQVHLLARLLPPISAAPAQRQGRPIVVKKKSSPS